MFSYRDRSSAGPPSRRSRRALPCIFSRRPASVPASRRSPGKMVISPACHRSSAAKISCYPLAWTVIVCRPRLSSSPSIFPAAFPSWAKITSGDWPRCLARRAGVISFSFSPWSLEIS